MTMGGPMDSRLLHYGVDWTRHWTPSPSRVVFPGSADELQGLIRAAKSDGIPRVRSGGRTGFSGAANGEVVVSMERMRAMTCHPMGWTRPRFQVECGRVTNQIRALLRRLS